MSGFNPNAPRRELWDGPVNRSFDEPDALKRIDDLLALIRPVEIDGIERQVIYPAEDGRVLRVVRKIIRGLAHHHDLFPSIPDDRVWADVQRYDVPARLLSEMEYHHREPDVAEYWYQISDDPEVHSAWILRIFHAPSFVGLITA